MTCKAEGLYYIFGKITFLIQRKIRYTFLLVLNGDIDNPLSQCLAGQQYGSTEPYGAENESFASCDFSLISTLQEGSEISVVYSGGILKSGKEIGPAVYVKKGATNLGFLKLSE